MKMTNNIVLLFKGLLLFLQSLVQGGHVCVHDDLGVLEGGEGIVSSPFIHNQQQYPQQNPLNGSQGQVAAVTATLNNTQPIRITPYLDYLQASVDQGFISHDIFKLISQNLLPVAYEWLGKVLEVQPVQGNLYLSPQCTSYYGNIANCASYVDAVCGFQTIPPEHYGPHVLCQANNVGGVVCNTIPGAVGVPNTDIIIYVYANQTGKCTQSPGTLAYASVCQQDQNDRPIAGFLNICPSALNASLVSFSSSSSNMNPMLWSLQVAITIHETSHILAISSTLFPYYRNPINNQPLTPRDSNNQPIGNSASNITVATFFERGNMVNKLVTPNALAAARNHFGCPTLNGLELEQQGGPATAMSHIEKRITRQEFMVGSLEEGNMATFSNLTLSIYADSGWYKVNYEYATPLSWGKNQGCNFAMQACVSVNTPNSNAKPSFNNSFCVGPSTTYQCDANYFSANLCGVEKYSSPLPSPFNYFTNASQYPSKGANIAGIDTLMDYCPFFTSFYLTGSTFYSDCRFAANTHLYTEYTGETYGSSSCCVQSDVIRKGYTYFSPLRCALYNCQYSVTPPNLYISLGDIELNCGTIGGDTHYVVSADYQGNITCPLVSAICTNPCPQQCNGFGVCNPVTQTCTCPPGWSGVDCSQIHMTPTSSSILPTAPTAIQNNANSIMSSGYNMLLLRWSFNVFILWFLL